MLELKIDDGLQELNLNGKVSVLLNLTDAHFVEKFFNEFEGMDKLQEDYKAALDASADDNKKVFEIARRMDAEMRDRINTVFGTNVCDPLFGDTNVYAFGGGLPLWCNLMFALLDEMDSTFANERKKTNPKVQKYLTKYGKK